MNHVSTRGACGQKTDLSLRLQMNGFDIQQVPGISFQDLFGSNNGEISMERVEAFLNKVVELASEQAQVNPNALVRVMHGGRITWMTHEQAAEYMKESSASSTIRQDVENALKGELKHIRQELEVLLAIAQYTLDQFRKNQLVAPEEIKRIEPGLQRRQYEIREGVSQTAESETLVEEKRRRNPIINEFELMMGQFLREKSKGDMQKAAELAKVLSEKKKQYILITRALEPDVRTIYYHRLNLQKTKKRLLHTQNELCSSRKDSLVIELNDLKGKLTSVKQQTQEAEYAGQDTAAATIDRIDLYDEGQVKREITEKVTELETLKKETAIIDRQEAAVDSVINTISVHVLGDTEVKVDLKAQLQKETMKMKPKPPQPGNEPKPKVKSAGMHIHRTKEGK